MDIRLPPDLKMGIRLPPASIPNHKVRGCPLTAPYFMVTDFDYSPNMSKSSVKVLRLMAK